MPVLTLTGKMDKTNLQNYHALFLTKDELKEIFRLNSDKALQNFKREFGIRKHGRRYLASDVRKVIGILTEEAA